MLRKECLMGWFKSKPSNQKIQSFRPTLLELEGRIVPSSVSAAPPVSAAFVGPYSLSATTNSVVSPSAQTTPDTLAPLGNVGGATVKYNFAPVQGASKNYSIKISITAGSYVYQQNFQFEAGDTPEAVQEVIYQSLMTANFVVIKSANSPAVIISGYKAAQTIVNIDKQTLDTTVLPDANKPRITGSLVNPPQGSQTQSASSSSDFNTPWGLSFDATSETSTEQQDSIIQVFLNGTEIDSDALKGMTSSQVDALVAANLANAGVDATVSGGLINFTNINGSQVNQVDVAYASAPTGDTYVPTLATTLVFPT